MTSARHRVLVIAIGASLIASACAGPVPSETPEARESAPPTRAPNVVPSALPTPEPSRAFPAAFPRQAIWFGRGWAATLDGAHRVELTDGELVGAVSDRLFATVQRLPHGSTRIRVRDIRSGEMLRDLVLDHRIGEVVLVDDALYMTGWTGSKSLGMLRLNISDGAVTRPVKPRPATLLAMAVRSPSGRIVGFQRTPVDDGQAVGPASIEILQVGEDTSRVVVSATETNLMALTDEVIVTRDEHRVRAYSVPSGRQEWEIRVRGTYPGYVTADGSRLIEPLFLDDGIHQDWVVAAIDLATGEIETTHPQGSLDIPLDHASNDHFVLFAGESDGVYVSLDLETGGIEEWPVPARTDWPI